MPVLKSSNASPHAPSRIASYGTVFLADAPVDAKLLVRRIADEVPQFSSPRLDASFLINRGRFIAGKSTTTVAPSTYVKRVAGSDFRSPKATVFYECSTELQGLLVNLTPKRAAQIATEWYGMHGALKANQRNPLVGRRYAWLY